MKSQRIVATAQSKIAVEDFELPSLEPDQVLIETQFSAISPGTELAFLHHLPNTPGVYPYYPGYSSSGHVADKGSAVTDLEVGQRVACNIRHAAHAIVEAGRCIPIPDGVSSQDAVHLSADFNCHAGHSQGPSSIGVGGGRAGIRLDW